MTPEAPMLHLIYRNHRGEIAYRRVFPARLWHGETKWHPEPQWFIHAVDMDSHKARDFALADVLFSWPGGPPGARPHIGDPAQAVERRVTELGEWAATLAAPAAEIVTAEPRAGDPPFEGL